MPTPASQCRILVHRQPLGCWLLAGHDHVHQVPAAQAPVGDAQETVSIRRQVDADDLRLLVDDVIDEPGILVAESVVILAPDMARQQVVERGDRAAPSDVMAHLQPLGVLVEHRIDDVNEGFVAVEEPVPAGEEVALEPSLALMLREHLHHPPLGRQVLVNWQDLADECPAGDAEDVLPSVRGVLVRAEDTEVASAQVLLHDLGEESPLDPRGFGR
jgi:hypothetical protein